MPYIGKDPGTGLRGRFIYTATAGQTSFTGADSLGRTLTYTDSEYTDVYLNGVKLDKTDYTATSGTSIVLDSGASAGDILEILAFDTFGLFSGEFAQDVTVAGALTVSGTTTTAATTMTGDLSLADKIVHTGDTNTAIRFPAADTVTVETSGSERMRIDSSGNVGLGRSPNYKLDAYISGSGSPAIASSNDSIVTAMQSVGTSQGNIGTLTSHPLVFTAGNTERMRILSGGGLTFNGDTATANALDDYEEGTWTPTYTALSTNPTAAYNVQIGRYVKVGQIVMASFRIQTSSNSGGVGSIFVAGLPFASENVTSMFTAGVVGYSATWVSHAPQSLFLGANSTQIQPLRNQTADAFSVISVGVDSANFSNVNGGNDLMGTITYRTSS